MPRVFIQSTYRNFQILIPCNLSSLKFERVCVFLRLKKQLFSRCEDQKQGSLNYDHLIVQASLGESDFNKKLSFKTTLYLKKRRLLYNNLRIINKSLHEKRRKILFFAVLVFFVFE